MILNVDIINDEWLQESLPVRNGGIGIRSAEMLAPFALFTSAAFTLQLQNEILPVSIRDPEDDDNIEAFHLGPNYLKQRSHLNCFGSYRKCGMEPLHQPFRQTS